MAAAAAALLFAGCGGCNCGGAEVKRPQILIDAENADPWKFQDLEIEKLKLTRINNGESVVLSDGKARYELIEPGGFAGKQKAELAELSKTHALFRHEILGKEQLTIYRVEEDENGLQKATMTRIAPGPQENPLKRLSLLQKSVKT